MQQKGKIKTKLFWFLTVSATLSILCVTIFYALYGHALIEAMYKGEAPLGVLNKVMRTRPHPLEWYLSHGDWLAVGVPLMAVIVWFLTVLVLMPGKVLSFLEDFRSRRKGPLMILSLLFMVLPFLTPFLAPPIVLAKVFAVWLGLTGILFWKTQGSQAARLGEIAASMWILVIFVFCTFFFIQNPLFLENMFDEYTFFENLQFIFYAFSGIFLAKAFLRTKNPFFILFALFCLFVAGEEINWGQRLFGLDTPEFLDNTQNETNLHNLRVFNSNFILTMLMVILAVVIPLVNRWVAFLKSFIRKIRFPIMSRLAILSVILGLLIHTKATHDYYRNTDEIRELFISFGFLIFAVQVYFENKEAS